MAAFDFDGTITTRSTFVPYLIRAFGVFRVGRALVRLTPQGLKVVCGRSDRNKLKDGIIADLFAGEALERLMNVGREYAEEAKRLLRPAAVRRIDWHRSQGHRLVMVSASLDLYLQPIAAALGFQNLLCTQISAAGLVCDGLLVGPNCRGPEKIRRLRALLEAVPHYELYAYGDAIGDRELLAAADHSFYRAFARGGELA